MKQEYFTLKNGTRITRKKLYEMLHDIRNENKHLKITHIINDIILPRYNISYSTAYRILTNRGIWNKYKNVSKVSKKPKKSRKLETGKIIKINKLNILKNECYRMIGYQIIHVIENDNVLRTYQIKFDISNNYFEYDLELFGPNGFNVIQNLESYNIEFSFGNENTMTYIEKYNRLFIEYIKELENM